MKIKVLILIFCFVNNTLFASDSTSVFKKRKLIFATISIGLTSSSLIYLNQIWYKPYKTSQFHTFNDNDEWLQMDKFGHIITNYQIARQVMHTMDWSGFTKKKQLLIGGLSGFGYMTAIELMDGYSVGWGFSWGDIASNALGSGFSIGQKILWNEQRMQLKISYSKSSLAQYNPNLLGKSFYEQILKDYNAQTYWLSINPSSFMKSDSKFPKWLNIAIGYGADGMLGAKTNNVVITDFNGNILSFNRYRQCYVSLDVDLTRIKTKSKVLKSFFTYLNIIKIPFPNIEFSEGRIKGNYF